MNSIPAQEIKRRGISAVDEALRQGPVHIIKNNRPQYVVLTEERFADLLEAQASAARDSLRTSLEDLKAGRITRHDDVDALMAAALTAGLPPGVAQLCRADPLNWNVQLARQGLTGQPVRYPDRGHRRRGAVTGGQTGTQGQGGAQQSQPTGFHPA